MKKNFQPKSEIFEKFSHKNAIKSDFSKKPPPLKNFACHVCFVWAIFSSILRTQKPDKYYPNPTKTQKILPEPDICYPITSLIHTCICFPACSGSKSES